MTVYTERQEALAGVIDDDSSRSDWTDWKWHVRNTIRTVSGFEKVLGIKFSDSERKKHEMTLRKFPLAITPYYLSLIDEEDYENDPVFLQSFPSPEELKIERCDMTDPLHEDEDSPVPGITHRYPDRVLFHISNLCSMYCRHCTRKRKVGDQDSIPSTSQLEKGIEYIRNTPQVRDVLLSGGDPFMLSDEKLDWILTKIGEIEHVEVVRIGTPHAGCPCLTSVTDDLVNMLKKHHPLWINTHFNHPREVTDSSRRAIAKLADAGIPLGNQSVLLAGVKRLSAPDQDSEPEAG